MSATTPSVKQQQAQHTRASTTEAGVDRNAEQYDKVPYRSLPFPVTQPARIGAIARLFGLTPPAAENARILEIGCASGGNIVPLAARFPGARIVGVDLSAVQVAEGRERIKRHALSNIEIRQISVTDFDAPPESFDYVICHGVFSWVNEAVRQAIFALVAKTLSPDGVAYISYNVLPGWRMRMAIRDAMMIHAGDNENPARRISRAKWMLNFLAQRTREKSVWGDLFRREAASLSTASEDYLFHEFLEDNNEPMTVTDFARGAGAHRLAYLGDADIGTMAPENIDAETAKALREICNGRALPLEQYMDIVTGRTFRQSLLVRAQSSGSISRRIEVGRLDGLHLLCSSSLHREGSASEGATFVDAMERGIRTGNAAVAQAIETMIARLPSSVTLAELTEGRDDKSKAEIGGALIRMLNVGLVSVSLAAVRAANIAGERPLAHRMTRVDAAAGPNVVNARHEAVRLSALAQVLAPALDGKSDREALGKLIEQAFATGRLQFRQGAEAADREAAARHPATLVEQALAELTRHALLEV